MKSEQPGQPSWEDAEIRVSELLCGSHRLLGYKLEI